MVLEVTLICAVLLAFFATAKARELANTIPRCPAALVALLMALVIGGHLSGKDRRVFPFPSWWMYGTAANPAISRYEITAITDDGKPVTVNPSQLHPSLGLGTFRIANHFRTVTNDRERIEESKSLAISFAESLARKRGDHFATVRVTEVSGTLNDTAAFERIIYEVAIKR